MFWIQDENNVGWFGYSQVVLIPSPGLFSVSWSASEEVHKKLRGSMVAWTGDTNLPKGHSTKHHVQYANRGSYPEGGMMTLEGWARY